MHPVLFKVGDFPVYSFGVLILAGVFLAVWMASRRAERFGFPPDFVAHMATWALVFGVIGARVAFILQDLPYFLEHRDQLFSLRFEGLTSFGGLIAGFLSVVYTSRKAKIPLLNVLDCVAPAVLLAHAVGRVGCLLNGCCYGGACDLPWGIHVAGEEGTFHPAQIYDGLMNLAGIPIILWVEGRRKVAGQSMALFLVVHGVARTIYEIWRAGTTSTTIAGLPITEAQVAAMAVVLIGVGLWIWSAQQPKGESS